MQLIIKDKQIEYNDAMTWFDNLNEEKIFVFEHKDIYTAGKSIINNNIEKNINNIHNIPAIHTNRGGLWTWHGKGQVVIYFIYNLRKRKLPLNKFMSIIENVVVKNVKNELSKYDNTTNFNIFADNNKRGFWFKKNETIKENNKKESETIKIQSKMENNIHQMENIDVFDNQQIQDNEKFGFIGLRITNGFVLHGISINYNNNLEYFDYINPCGLGNVKITSIKNILIENSKFYNQTQTLLDINNFKLSIGNDFLSALSNYDER